MQKCEAQKKKSPLKSEGARCEKGMLPFLEELVLLLEAKAGFASQAVT